MPRPRKRLPDRYRFRFFGRLIQKFVGDRADRDDISQGAVADWLGVSADQLSRWILGHSLPASDEDWNKLGTLAGDKYEDLVRAARKDRIDYTRREESMDATELRQIAKEIEAYARRVGE